MPEVWIRIDATYVAGSENLDSEIKIKFGRRQACISNASDIYVLTEYAEPVVCYSSFCESIVSVYCILTLQFCGIKLDVSRVSSCFFAR